MRRFLVLGLCMLLGLSFVTAGAQTPRKDLELREDDSSIAAESPAEPAVPEVSTAEWRQSLPTLWAILIGINQYDDPNIQRLRYAVPDAEGVREVLSDLDRMPYRTVSFQLFTDNSDKKPTRNNIFNHLAAVAKMAEPEDTILFFFSGHGIEQDGISYLLPQDAGILNPARTALAFSDISADLAKSKARKQVFILDACHSGGTRRDKGVGEGASRELISRLAQAAEAEGRVVLSSCGVDQVSYEFTAKSHGVYTFYLMEALSGPGDLDQDGLITVDETHQYLLDHVREWSIQNSLVQVPRKDQSNVTDPIVLALSEVGGRAQVVSASPSTPTTRIADYDGMQMVFIPAGRFIMGSPPGEGRPDQQPRHEVYLDAFYIDAHEVTNAQYAFFLEATGHPNKPAFWDDPRFNAPNQPVVGVSWYDAEAYAAWAGRRLPTEAEWERAIRGTNASAYPWGNTWQLPTDSPDGPQPVIGKPEPNNPAIYGLSGNVSEWVADYYRADYYRTHVGEWRNPTGPESGGLLKLRVIRGASWDRCDEETSRCAFREKSMPNLEFRNVGFRLAKTP